MKPNCRFVADSVLDARFGNPIVLFERSANSGALISAIFGRLACSNGYGGHENQSVHHISVAFQVSSAHQIPVRRSRNYDLLQLRL